MFKLTNKKILIILRQKFCLYGGLCSSFTYEASCNQGMHERWSKAIYPLNFFKVGFVKRQKIQMRPVCYPLKINRKIHSRHFSSSLTSVSSTIFELQHDISNNVVCAISIGSDQPAHMRSLIRAFVSHLNIL